MENYSLSDYLIINSRAKTCLMKYILHFFNFEDNSKHIKPKNIVIDVTSTSEKSLINKIYYSMVIKNTTYNTKFDVKKNIPIYEKMKGFFYQLKDECNNRIYDNEISIKVDLLPFIQNKMVIDFKFFNFFYYNGTVFHKFILNPNNDDDFKDNKRKLFIYFSGIDNKTESLNLKNDLYKIIGIKHIWKIFSYIYIIIPVINKNKAIDIYKNLPDFLKNKKDDKFKVTCIYLSDDIYDGNAINIFTNLYKKKNKNYFFILNNSNIVFKLNEYQKILTEIKKYIDLIYSKNDPVQLLENSQNIKKINKMKLFIHLTNFINDLSNLNYIFDFHYNMKFTIKLNETNYYFKTDKIEKIEIGGSLRTEEYNKFKKYFDNINDEDFYFKLKEIKTVNIDIDFSKEIKCKICKQIIPEKKECYYCHVCKDFYCYKCVKNNFETKLGKAKFIDQKHNLLFFKTRNKNNFLNIDEAKLGINSFSKLIDFKSYHSASCDGCGSSFHDSPRYICISCKPGLYLSEGYNDYCNICVEHMMNNDEKGKIMQKEPKIIKYSNSSFVSNHVLKQLHNHENHIYLMVALEGVGTSYQGF